MGVFTNCAVVLELKDLPFKEKKKVRLAITDNGGSISYVVNKQCTFVVVSSLGCLSSNRQQSSQKLQVPVVGLAYVWACLEKNTLLPATEHILVPMTPAPDPAPSFQPVRQVPLEEKYKHEQDKDPPQSHTVENQIKNDANYVYNHRIYSEHDKDLPMYPSHFQVAKYSVFASVYANVTMDEHSGDWCVLELQSARGEKGCVFRVVRYMKQRKVVRDQLVWCGCAEDALQVYQQLQERLTATHFEPKKELPPTQRDLGSLALKQLLLEEDQHCSTPSQEVGVFVELVWTEALGSLAKVLNVPALSISPNDVSRAEGLLLQVRRVEGEGERRSLLEEVRSVLPHTLPDTLPIAKLVSQALDLCQVLRDTLAVNEVVMRSFIPSSLGKYRALGCSIQSLHPQSPDYHTVTQLLQHNDSHSEIKIHNVFHVQRGVELQMFREELGNVKPLLHSTGPASFVGILSRGLLLPRVGVESHGVERTDVGFLGGGIYFSDSFSTSVKYSRPSVTDGSRLLLVCEVALGRCREFRKRDTTLTSAPEGYDSVHGVRNTANQPSEFEDDEYVVYSPDQVRLKYVVQYTLPDDQVKDFQPCVDTSVESIPQTETSDTLPEEDSQCFKDFKNPLDSVTAGLLDSAGQTLPLQAVHVKCKLVDLLSQVIIFQTYSNPNSVPIEAKYVFPLEESAAVCGFEAFINGKHVIGEVKEKEQARKEYKQAIAKGHGAYLMDQEAPDVFTISVGNLPPGATVLIKITFISELLVERDAIFFQLPGSVAPWQQSSALNERTQSTVEKVCVSEHNGDFSLSLSMEMPYEINNLHCSTHKIQTKKTECKAVVRTLPGEMMGSNGFQLYIRLREMHMPRMWVENHPDKDSQACMLVFFPDFEALQGAGEEPSPASGPGCGVEEVVLLLDSSESMRGEALANARQIAVQIIKHISYEGKKPKINVVLFGTEQKDAFVFSKELADGYQPAKQFVRTSPPVGGSTELWRPLRSFSLLPPSRGTRSLVLLSDGHVHNPALTMQLARSNAAHTRLFTCGLSKTANKHMLRALAQAGGGAFEFFDTKTRHTWLEKVKSTVRRMTSPGCSSVSVKWQLFNPTAPSPVQAPAQLHSLFSNHHTLVYGFVPHCTQATLYGDLCGKEIRTMVSTTELQKTKGTFLHKLTARAVIRDYEDGILHMDEAEHEGKKAEMKSFIVDLSKEFSILSQFTSFVAIEERDPEKPDKGFTDIPKLIAEEDVDLLPYMGWEDDSKGWEKAEVELFIKASIDQILSRGDTLGDLEEMHLEDLHTDGHPGTLTSAHRVKRSSSGSFQMDGLPEMEEGLEPIQGKPLNLCLPKPSAPARPASNSAFKTAKRTSRIAYCSSRRSKSPLHSGSHELLGSSPGLESSAFTPALNSISGPAPLEANVRGALFGPQVPVSLGYLGSLLGSGTDELDALFAPDSLASETNRKPFFGFNAALGSPALSRLGSAFGHPPPDSGLFGVPPFLGSPAPPAFSHDLLPICGDSALAPPPPASGPFGVPPVFGSPAPPAFSHDLLPICGDSAFGPPPPASGPFGVPPIHGSPAPTAFSSLSASYGAPVLAPVPDSTSPPSPTSSCRLRSAGFFGDFVTHRSPSSDLFTIQALAGTPASAVKSAPAPAPAPPPPPPALDAIITSGFGSMRRVGQHRTLARAQAAPPPPPASVPIMTSGLGSMPKVRLGRAQAPPPPPSPPCLQFLLSAESLIPESDMQYTTSGVLSAPSFQFPSQEFQQHKFLGRRKGRHPAPKSPPMDAEFELALSHHDYATADGDAEFEHALSHHDYATADGDHYEDYHASLPAIMGDLLDPVRTKYSAASSLFPQSSCIIQSEPRRDVRSQDVATSTATWEQLACLQSPEGYWECTEEVGWLLAVDLKFFANVFLKEKGISSLGPKAHADILRLVSTLLVLQLVRVKKLVKGELLQSLFRLREPPEDSCPEWEALKRAVDWVCWADRQYPCVCSRLEFGRDWESSTRQLLGFDRPHPLSPLTPLLQRNTVILAC
ncbi:hypothetical protein ACEWY4_022929 [Coilia grayii]|uniref:Poly [ADP-ribose] polymerase n=1 Tax=Coilia grayii TaxID=363190 RepID=A0ABD1J372_9TELE